MVAIPSDRAAVRRARLQRVVMKALEATLPDFERLGRSPLITRMSTDPAIVLRTMPLMATPHDERCCYHLRVECAWGDPVVLAAWSGLSDRLPTDAWRYECSIDGRLPGDVPGGFGVTVAELEHPEDLAHLVSMRAFRAVAAIDAGMVTSALELEERLLAQNRSGDR